MTSLSPTWNSLRKGIHLGVGNSILVKVNQIGSLTETLDAVELAMGNRYTAVISPPFRRNGGRHHRGHCRRNQRRTNQNRLFEPFRPYGQI